MKKIIAVALSILPLAFHFNIDRANAEIDNEAKTQVGNTLTLVNNGTELDSDTAQEKSDEYVRRGLNAQKRGEEDIAIGYFYKALKLNPENAYAFMGAAIILGRDTKEGVMAMKAAAALFLQQNNLAAYKLAAHWLKQED